MAGAVLIEVLLILAGIIVIIIVGLIAKAKLDQLIELMGCLISLHAITNAIGVYSQSPNRAQCQMINGQIDAWNQRCGTTVGIQMPRLICPD